MAGQDAHEGTDPAPPFPKLHTATSKAGRA